MPLSRILNLSPTPTPFWKYARDIAFLCAVMLFVDALTAPSIASYFQPSAALYEIERTALAGAFLLSFAGIERLYYWLRGELRKRSPKA